MPFRLPGRKCAPITLYGNPVLRTPAEPVEVFDRQLGRLVDDLFDTMYAIETGVGLAANQIGRLERVFVFDCGGDEVGYVVNPVLTPIGDELQHGTEACLSLPGVSMPTNRHLRSRVVGVDVTGAPVAYTGEELLARCFQHEVQHLDGVLYIDNHPDDVRSELDLELRSADWFGRPSIDPAAPLYRRSQVEG